MNTRLHKQTNDLVIEFVRIMTGREMPAGSDLSHSTDTVCVQAWCMAEAAQMRLCGVGRSSFYPEEHAAQFVPNAVVRYTEEFLKRRSGNPAVMARRAEHLGVVTTAGRDLVYVRWFGSKAVAATSVAKSILTVVRMATAEELRSLHKNGQLPQS